MEKSKLRIDCLACEHYFVTWDKDFPHGCRAMGFKSRSAPSADVYRSSGMECQRYSAKSAKTARRKQP